MFALTAVDGSTCIFRIPLASLRLGVRSSQMAISPKSDLQKPVVLVTGGGRRVGAVIARHLAGAGYSTVIHANRSIDEARRLAAEFTASGHDSIALAADL